MNNLPPSPDQSALPGETAAAPAPSALDQAQAKPPGIVSIMCPTGFTPYATEGLTLDQPLFARVTYRPF